MKDNKTSISQADSYAGIADYWDKHDLAEVWEQTEAVQFDVEIEGAVTYFAVESGLSEKLRKLAKKQGVSAETLLNLWLQERFGQEATESAA